MKRMLVLAGGFGTRLRSIVKHVPKPLAPVSKKPFIIYLLNNWISKGVKEFVFLLHYEANIIQQTLNQFTKNIHNEDIKIDIVVEDRPLGTGGSILNAINVMNIKESFLVTNADTWIGNGFKEISNIQSPSIATVYVENPDRYGSIEIKENLVEKFIEKAESKEGGFISSGLYHLSPSVFDNFKPGESFSLEKEIFPKLVTNKELKALKLNSSFIDIGIPKDYRKFCLWIKNNKKGDIN
tara:strand:+ start:1383 stop:2099 length:717 start_codon:yes stop_codon:yes gene_type:complete